MSEMPTPMPPPPGPVSQDEKTWGIIAHLSALSGYIIPLFGWIIGPLVVYLIKKEQLPFAAGEAKSALNFQITVAIAALVCFPLVFVCIGIPLLALIGLFDLIFMIVAAVKASDGVPYKYPLTFPFVK